MKRIRKTIEQWRQELTPEQFRVTRLKGTEAPFSGEYNGCKAKGIYRCVCCGAALFESGTKFDSGSGWPSFTAPADTGNLREEEDLSHGMRRIEIQCDRCGAHLGHLFPDGPAPTGQRYCINSAALDLKKKEE